ELDVSVTVANNVVGSGSGAEVTLEAAPSAHLQLVGASKQKLKIAEMHEASTQFKVRIKPVLGAATLTFMPSYGEHHSKLAAEMSVRPATPYMSTFAAGHLKSGNITVPVARSLHPEFRTLTVGISHLPLGLTHGLVGYLQKFPYGCTEQIVSQA